MERSSTSIRPLGFETILLLLHTADLPISPQPLAVLALVVDICGSGPAVSSAALGDLLYRLPNSFKQYILEATFGRFAFSEEFSPVMDVSVDCGNFQATCNVDDIYSRVLGQADVTLNKLGLSSGNFAHRVSFCLGEVRS